MKSDKSILFFGRKDHPDCYVVYDFLKNNFSDVFPIWNRAGDEIGWWQGDYIISYLSKYIIPKHLIDSASVAAINFHPGSPQYPGIGCVNFALYENADSFGVTCHFMDELPDTGGVIRERWFPIFKTDNVTTLLIRTYDYLLILFYEVCMDILFNYPLESRDKWFRKPFTRKQLDELATITPDMSKDEVYRRIRATTYKQWKPKVKLHEFEFEHTG